MSGSQMLGTMKVGAKRQPKAPDEHYDTPVIGTIAFLEAELSHILAHGSRVWENACGTGACARVMESFGLDVTATTLVDRGYGADGVDFLKTRKLRNGISTIITNPPFSMTEAFIRHAMKLGVRYLALLLPSIFWHPTEKANRDALQREFTPSFALPLGFRLDFEGLGSPVMDCAWYVWDWLRPPLDHCIRYLPALRKPLMGGSS